MQPGEVMNPGDQITSSNGKYLFTYQTDGNLVLYRDARTSANVMYATGTDGRGVGLLTLQPDGNLVIYGPPVSKQRQVIFATNTDRYTASHLDVQDDGNVVLYGSAGGTNPVWSTNTFE